MHIPTVLADAVTLDGIMERLPESYQKAVFARSIASSFVYQFGLDAGFEDYRQFVEELASAGSVRSTE